MCILKVLRNKSSILTLATLCLLVLIIGGGFFTLYLTRSISTDAETINKLGVIRGSTQRLVKLELYGVDNKGLEKDIQGVIDLSFRILQGFLISMRSFGNLSPYIFIFVNLLKIDDLNKPAK